MEKSLPHDMQRIVQELVPGRQLTLAHAIANPDASLYKAIGLDSQEGGAMGILTLSPSEAAIIAGDIAIKASGVSLGFVDLEKGSLLITGRLSAVESALIAVRAYVRDKLGFAVCELTRT